MLLVEFRTALIFRNGMISSYLYLVLTHFKHFVHEQAVCKELEIKKPAKNIAHAIRGYALRFLKYNSSPVASLQEEVPATPERITDSGMMDISEDDLLMEVCIPTFFMFFYICGLV